MALLLALVGTATACQSDEPAEPSVTWASSEDGPVCAYDSATQTVRARVVVTWGGSGREDVDVAVTVYADENTSKLVGVTEQTVTKGGEETTDATVVVPVQRPPHRGEDGETACRVDLVSEVVEGIPQLPER